MSMIRGEIISAAMFSAYADGMEIQIMLEKAPRLFNDFYIFRLIIDDKNYAVTIKDSFLSKKKLNKMIPKWLIEDRDLCMVDEENAKEQYFNIVNACHDFDDVVDETEDDNNFE